VDLKSIYAWTRAQLEAEAKRRGIESYSSLTRAQLISLIAGGMTVGQEAMRLAQNALSATFSSAVIRLPRRLDALRSLTRRLPASLPWAEKKKPDPRPYETAGRGAFPRAEAKAGEKPPAGRPERRSIAVTKRFQQEPVRTRSMAQMLAAQGHRQQASSIYDELMAKIPGDRQLRQESEAVLRGEPVGVEKVEKAERVARVSSADAIVLPKTEDVVRSDGEAAAGLVVNWKVTEQGMQRAAAVLGRDGELAIRIMAVVPDPQRVVRSEVTEHGPVEYAGSWTSPSIPSGSRCFTVVGLRAGSRFVAIVHAPAKTIS
jgi:hypothetical protein